MPPEDRKAHAANVHPIPADGRRWVGPLEEILHRQWPPDVIPPQQILTAIDRIAALPSHVAGRLLEGVEGIYVGIGMVPDLDDMQDLRGQPIHPDRPHGATWDLIPGAYRRTGYRKGVIVIGSAGKPLTIDLFLHEVGHALDDLDGGMSDSADFLALHYGCSEVLVDDRYIHSRAEAFAEFFALASLRAWDVLEDLLGGATSRAYGVRSWYGRNYDLGR
jgi:hypothetical protein